ncbi:cupin domain-containing protein [Nocardioides sp. YIM 152315]|uniref:cupin domain-containing protein n=1 Tax=Nocardioides sp. YIM 152315 TaxID=3031760 RepID=UPI0023DA2A22|nr:cupin domain-containing protein [Nocardioides sp. YIM 152315]MDF1604404.1 cupin domain-containing protein [Nocardioides sp. YIM 152315]
MTRALCADVLTVGLGPDRTLALDAVGDTEVGVWEMPPGTEQDTEADEVFVVLAGRGTVTFDDGEVVELRPGVAVRLRGGERTTWTVTETLRKVYVAVTPAAR